MYFQILFSDLRNKVYLRRYGRPTCAVIFTRSLICWTQVVQILFCIDKARKRSFTEVALNSVLEENAIDFAWEVYSPNKNIYEQCICCVSQLISSAVQSRHFAYCAQCNAYFALCAQKKCASFAGCTILYIQIYHS